MAERRMFAKTIIDSDAFLDMPLSTQALYFHLSMRADDDGFVNNPKKILRMIGASDDDFKLLILKKFVIPFESGVCVIKHWFIHNYIRSDRYKETVYKEEKSQLYSKENKAYTLNPPEPIPTLTESGMSDGIPDDNQAVDNWETQVRLGKDRVSLGKDSIGLLSGAETAPDQNEPPKNPPVITITLNDKTEYPIFDADIENWKELYPAVDILQELRKMKGWADSNPSKRKTSRGIKRFINAWLAKEQDKYHGPQGGVTGGTDSSNSSGQYGTWL